MDLHDAAKEGNCEHLERLIGIGCSVDELDHKRMTALAYASQSTKATTGVLRLLLDSGADPNLPVSEDRKYAVGLAASSGSIAKVQLLLDAGADIRYLSKGSYSILVHCIYGLYDSEDLSNMLQFLHANGADLDAESDYGESPLSVASRFGRFDAVKCLLDRGANELSLGWNHLMTTMAWGTDAEFQTVLNDEKDLGYCDRYGRSAWHLSAFGPYLEKAKMLLGRGVDINAPVRGGEPALMICAERGNVDMLTWLIVNGAKIDATDDSGATAIMAATRSRQVDCLGKLLSAGANPSHKDKYGGNAMSVASDSKSLRLLEDAGEDISDLSTESKRRLLGFTGQDRIECTVDDYRSGCNPRFGDSNLPVRKTHREHGEL